MQSNSTIPTNLEGKTVSWRTVHGIRSGVITEIARHEKDGSFLGYMVKLNNNKDIIVHPNSFIQCADQ